MQLQFSQKALDAVRICKEDQELIFKILAAILWLGNISFKVTDSENHIEVVGDEGKIHRVSSMPFDGLFAPHAVLSRLIRCH